jgi:release factor glutamine methyltransferase
VQSSSISTIGELKNRLIELISSVSGDLSYREADDIIEHTCSILSNEVTLNSSKPLSQKQILEAINIAKIRSTDTPLAYILKKQYFFSKEFELSTGTLIPRHDTEHLIDEILTNEKATPLLFLELGTGSGIIPEILTSENTEWSAITCDFSTDALTTANKNCGERVSLVASDKFSAIKPLNQFDFIVSNPPYIPTEVVKGLDKSVVDHEPLSALDGGEDGLIFYHYLSEIGESYLKEGGRIYLEIGYDQGESVPAILKNLGWQNIVVRKDFGDRDRVVSALVK